MGLQPYLHLGKLLQPMKQSGKAAKLGSPSKLENKKIINLWSLPSFEKSIIMKSLEEFVELFAEQFDDTDVSEIKANTIFRDLDEWSSLIALSIIAMVDEELDVALKGEDVRNSVTVEDLYKNVCSKIKK